MSQTFTTDVVIVGAGPTGLTLACELARRGVSLRLIEKRSERAMISKAAGIMPRSLEVFENIGVVDAFLEAGIHCPTAAVYSNETRILQMEFSSLDTPFPLILGLPQYETERILEEHLTKLGAKIERSFELVDFEQDNDGVTVTLLQPSGETETVRARYLVGCDGSRSGVRKRLGVPFEGASFHENYIVANLAIDWDMPHDETFEFHSPTGTIAGIPLPENTWSIGLELDESQWNYDHPPYSSSGGTSGTV